MRMRLMLVSAVALGCSGAVDVPPPTDSPLTCVLLGITVNPAAASLSVGDSVRLTASSGSCGTAVKVEWTWSSSDTTKATVDRTGLVRARANGLATITASAVLDPTVKGAALITVQPLPRTDGGGVTILSINQIDCSPSSGVCTSVPANLAKAAGALDVVLGVDGVRVPFSATLILNDGLKDTVVAAATFSDFSQVKDRPLRWNTSVRSASGTAAFPNGKYTVRAQAKDSSHAFNSSSVSITLANP